MASDTGHKEVLDERILGLLGESLEPADIPLDRSQTLRARVMERVDKEPATPLADHVTIRLAEGDWIKIAPKIEKKVLRRDLDAGTEAYLLRVGPGATAPAHQHQFDEFCIVLSGEVSFADIHLKAGDFHFSPRGSHHGMAHTSTGALVYLETSLSANTVAL